MKKIGMLGVLVLVAGVALGATWRPLTEQERSVWGATHAAELTYSDLTTSTTNTAQTVTNVVTLTRTTLVECVSAELVTTFDTGSTNWTGSVAMEVGDGTDADLFVTSMELAEDGTEVYLKPGRTEEGALTGTTQTFTNVVYGGTAVTGNVSTVTYTLATTRYGQKLYTGPDTIDFKFTPNVEEALSANTAGCVRVYFKIRERR